MFDDFYRNRRVLVTGHTGFKGSWLCEWLLQLGADVTGYSLPPPTVPALFDQLGLRDRLAHHEGDVRDRDRLADVIASARPDVVFHLAAQAIVREAYEEPVATLAVNVMGTAHLLDVARSLDRPCAVVVVTSDKVYENREWPHGYREPDPLGGHDPYSASKACAELVAASFRRSFLQTGGTEHVAVATARAGNVLGGGDWARDRIVPDCVRSLRRKETIGVRNPAARRPWQHVLEPLAGYLLLARRLHPDAGPGAARHRTAYNFGPPVASNRTIGELVDAILSRWDGTWRNDSDPRAPHEAGLLHLNWDRAWHELRWHPVWDFDETVDRTVVWYRENDPDRSDPSATAACTRRQIRDYGDEARRSELAWAQDLTDEDTP